jgi:hypothetical protein
MLSPQEICKRILEIHEKIRWVVIYDSHGKIILESKKDHVDPYLDASAMKTFRTLWVRVILGIVGRLTQYYGNIQFVHTEFRKATLFSLPYAGGAVVITSEPNVPSMIFHEIGKSLTELYRGDLEAP